jgi:RNA polymerase sigma factor (sigma-70 family)
MPRLVEDRELLDAFRRGERPALEEVYREYLRPLYSLFSAGFSFDSGGRRHLFKPLTHPAEREDAVQEVFLRAFSPSARLAYDGVNPYRNYLFTIARNLVIDRFRARERNETSPLEPAEPSAEEGPARPDEGLDQEELALHCSAFLASLEPVERKLFEARFREGLSIEVTARELKLSEHQVKRGEKALKKRFFLAMKQQGFFEGFRYGRGGLEKLAGILVFTLGTLR